MRILIAAVLSAALLLLVPTPAKQINNSTSPLARHESLTLSSAEQEMQSRATPQVTKQDEVVAVQNAKEVEPEAVTESKTVAANTPTCANEVQRYSWNKSVAHAVMMAESNNNPDNHNDTPSTGDYSIGCFQINLKGTSNLNAKYRDSVRAGYTGAKTVSGLETWLKNAKNNVAVAHIMWSDQGWNPWGATTCKYKVRCG
jgi:hypothetical protein